MAIERGLFLDLARDVDERALLSSERQVEKDLKLKKGLGGNGIPDGIIDDIRRGISQSLVRGGNYFSAFGGETLKAGLMYPWEEIDSERNQIVRGDDGNFSLTLARVNFSNGTIEYSPLYLKLRAYFMAGEEDKYSQLFGKYPVEQTTMRELHRFNAYRMHLINRTRDASIEDKVATEFARESGEVIDALVHNNK